MLHVGRIMIVSAVLVVGNVGLAQQGGDKGFLENLATENFDEEQLGKLALSRTANEDVKSLASRMVHDHQRIASDMKPFLSKAGVQPAMNMDPKQQQLLNRLKALSGDDFDKEYVKTID